MADSSKIEWTDATWNFVTGCDEVSPGCDMCYARTFAERWRGIPGHHFENGFDITLRPERLNLPFTWKKPRKVFVNSMSDLFHKDIPTEFIAKAFAVMALTPQHSYQVLTKRHARMRSLLNDRHFAVAVRTEMYALDRDTTLSIDEVWPLPNLWLGVSAENQKWADIRIPALLDTPAAIRWISAEPLLGPLDLTNVDSMNVLNGGDTGHENGLHWVDGPTINWIVAGGESGPKARPAHTDWFRTLRDQCTAADVPFLFKQHGAWGPAPFIVRVCDPDVGWQGTDEELAAAKADSEARGATHVHTGNWYEENGERRYHVHEIGHKPWSLERVELPPGTAAIRRWGKGKAGRELDGRTWDQYPEPR